MVKQQNNSSKGYLKINRKITEWKWWHNNTARGIWLYILTEANWADGYLRSGETIKRGSLARSMRTMATDSGVSLNTLRYWLGQFKKSGEITQTTTHGYTVINIVNYDKYQASEDSNHTDYHTPTDTVTDTLTDTLTDTDIRRIRRKEEKKYKSTLSDPTRPTREQIQDFISEKRLRVSLDSFWDYYETNGWTGRDGQPLRNWKNALMAWDKREKRSGKQTDHVVIPAPDYIRTTEEMEFNEEDLPF